MSTRRVDTAAVRRIFEDRRRLSDEAMLGRDAGWFIAWHPLSPRIVLRRKDAEGLYGWVTREWGSFEGPPDVFDVTEYFGPDDYDRDLPFAELVAKLTGTLVSSELVSARGGLAIGRWSPNCVPRAAVPDWLSSTDPEAARRDANETALLRAMDTTDDAVRAVLDDGVVPDEAAAMLTPPLEAERIARIEVERDQLQRLTGPLNSFLGAPSREAVFGAVRIVLAGHIAHENLRMLGVDDADDIFALCGAPDEVATFLRGEAAKIARIPEHRQQLAAGL